MDRVGTGGLSRQIVMKFLIRINKRTFPLLPFFPRCRFTALQFIIVYFRSERLFEKFFRKQFLLIPDIRNIAVLYSTLFSHPPLPFISLIYLIIALLLCQYNPKFLLIY